ncbi:MAG: MFS transporter [Clostridium sp.]|nr:MFS transporter [Clostridium sp.]
MSKLLKDGKNIKLREYIVYIMAVFFYTNMTGMINEYRRAYFVDGLKLSTDQLSFFNVFTGIAGFALSFVYAMILDNKKIKNGNKFKGLGMAAAVPCGLITILIFWTPGFIQNNPTVLMIWLCAIALIQGACFYFGGTVNMVAVVMSPDSREREQLLSFRGISSAIGNSAPLVIVLVIAAITKAIRGTEDNELNYLIAAILCGVIGTVTMLLGMGTVKERITYKEEKKNPLVGFVDVLKNPHARRVLYSEFLKSFRGISTFMQPFIAAAMLGSSSKTLLFALPIGVGTMVGMLIINALLKKFASRVLYIASGVYSVCINLIAFGVGYLYLTKGQPVALNIVFIVCLFGTGLQFGASNLLPDMFKADILDDIELKTGKRLDASLPFVIGIGGTISGLIANGVVPYILYDNEATGWKSIIGYQQGLADGTEQELKTKIMLLFFYTVVHGIMMLLAGVPFFTYKLTGEERDRVHNEVLKKRGELPEE